MYRVWILEFCLYKGVLEEPRSKRVFDGDRIEIETQWARKYFQIRLLRLLEL
jgi:hypothetical protein